MAVPMNVARFFLCRLLCEEDVIGFPEFRNVSGTGYGQPLTITREEALQRPIYTAFASRKIDVGNP